MNTVRISKKKLLDQLEKNRNDHKFIYDAAMEGFKKSVVTALYDAYKKAQKGEEYITDMDLDEPVCHLDEYNNIIARVNWNESDFIELDRREFDQFILDKWDWQYNFLTSSSSYSMSSSSSSTASRIINRKMETL